jgi:hypothetical protein
MGDMRNTFAILVCLAGLALAGCTPPAPRPPAPTVRVDNITMLAMPALVNLDGLPGPDGLRVDALYFFRADKPEPLPIAGTLEFRLYEGVVRRSNLGEATPLHTWRFSGERLQRSLRLKGVGWGYQMILPWEDDGPSPAASSVTLVSRYSHPEARPVWSEPTSIFIGE